MNGFNYLASTNTSGFWWLVLLFILCFFGVHTARLIKLFLHSKKPNPPEPQPKPQPPEPVYYIVEKKKKRPSVKYSAPKEFKFK